jgi:aminomethyltransferase
MEEIKKTFLNQWHADNGGNLVGFGDYEMPLWYSSVKKEHLGVLTHAGMFDTSHMAVVMAKGPDAFDLIQFCFTRDLNACIGKDKLPIATGRCVYGAYLDESGYAIDDAIIGKVSDTEYMIVVNAGMGGTIAKHMETVKGDRQVDITDLTDKLGKFDIQGPLSVKIMQKVLKDPEKVFDKMVYFSFKGHFDPSSPLAHQVQLKDGTPLLLSRSGYTGEVGFEVFIAHEDTVKAWETIMAAGQEFGCLPCGLAARDSLRTGSLLPLSHQDIGHWIYLNHPWCFALPYADDGSGFTKDFIGAKALIAAKDTADHTVAFVGNDLRKVDAHDARVLDADGNDIGTVLTCATDIAVGRIASKIYSITSPDKPENFKAKGLCCGYVKVKTSLNVGETITLQDKKRKLTVSVAADVRPDRTARKPLKTFM